MILVSPIRFNDSVAKARGTAEALTIKAGAKST